jgi:hypothetical protein
MRHFQRRADGEYCQCQSCVARGYGEDSWHPATTEFWRAEGGKLRLARCRACESEAAAKTGGMVTGERLAA